MLNMTVISIISVVMNINNWSMYVEYLIKYISMDYDFRKLNSFDIFGNDDFMAILI